MRAVQSAASTAVLGIWLICVLSGCQLDKGSVGRVHLVLGGGGARTVLPVVSVSSYRVSFSGPASQSPVSTTQSNLTIELEPGTWSISVEGMDGGGNTVAVGGASGVVVTAGGLTPVSIVLAAQSSGNGTIDVTVTWPTMSPVIDSCVVTLGPVGVPPVAVPPGTVTFTPGGTSVRYTQGQAAGNYRLSINLYSGTVLRAPVQEAVQVYGNLASSATIALVAADFTSPPAAPSGLVVAEGLGELDLSWVNNSHVATSYEVDRSTDNVSFTVLSASLPPDTTSYKDTTAATGQTYWYRVGAANSLGSAYSTAVSAKVQAPTPGGGGGLTFSAVSSSSIGVSWQMATDNVSAQTVLSYKVVRSLSNNVQTVEAAQASGTVVQDWTLDVAAVNATGLISGTPYYFNVLVKDGAGNVSAYSSSSTTTFMVVSMSISVTSPQEQTITFSQVNDIVVAARSMLNITAGQGFDSYAWVLDGVVLSGQTTATAAIDSSSLLPGSHHLTIFVRKSGMEYSNTLRFQQSSSSDVQAPTPGGGGGLTFSAVTSSSISVSWPTATDNVSSQTALSYRIVSSLSNNVQTVEAAQANGTVVQDWALNVAAVNATGLSSGTPYYFNVLVKDGAGNISAYSSGSTTTLAIASLSITVTPPQEQAITFNQPNDIVVAAHAVMSITVGQVFDSYAWMLDGAVLSGQTTATAAIDCSSLLPGSHHLTIFVQKNGMEYSNTLRFQVQI